MKVLLTGANGQLGCCIKDAFPLFWSLKAMDHTQLDITNKEQIKCVIESFQPNAIINAAAYTAVDKAEQQIEKANLVNHIGPKYLAELSEQYNIRLIHISTDYVFNGEKQTPYLETDITSPINVYGRTKLSGERAVLANNPSAIVIRTSWVFSEYGNNFIKTMLKLAKDKNELSVVADQFGCPTYARDLAEAIIKIILKNVDRGIYHYCGDSSITWYDFAKIIFEQARLLGKLPHPVSVFPLTTDQYPTLAKRPKYSIMDTSKIIKLGLVPSCWKAALMTVIEHHKNNQG